MNFHQEQISKFIDQDYQRKVWQALKGYLDLWDKKIAKKNCDTLLDVSVSSLRRGHANLLCIVPILADDPRGVPITSNDNYLSPRINGVLHFWVGT